MSSAAAEPASPAPAGAAEARAGESAAAAEGAQAGPRLERLWDWSCEQTRGLAATCLAWCKARSHSACGN